MGTSFYDYCGEVGPTLSHSWVKLLQTVLIIFRVSFNVKQKMSEIGREGARISASLTAPAIAPEYKGVAGVPLDSP